MVESWQRVSEKGRGVIVRFTLFHTGIFYTLLLAERRENIHTELGTRHFYVSPRRILVSPFPILNPSSGGGYSRAGSVSPALILIVDRGQPRRYLRHFRDIPVGPCNTISTLCDAETWVNNACPALITILMKRGARDLKDRVLTTFLTQAYSICTLFST